MWAGRRVVLGVSGGIASYKSCILARRLTEAGAQVDVVMTQGAGAFVANAARAAQRYAQKFRSAQPLVAQTVEQLRARGLNDDEIRRLFEAELAGFSRAGGQSG